MPITVDASNSCIPPSCNISSLIPPLPTTERGVPLSLDGSGGRINADKPLLVYPSGRLVVVRDLSFDVVSDSGGDNSGGDKKKQIKAFVYRGHTANVTTAKFSPSGCYIASGDTKGKLRVWSFDNEEHLCKLNIQALAGPIRDLSWDFESKRIVLVGQGSKIDATSICTKVIQWDTGVTVGSLAQHNLKKASSCSFKLNRPMRVVTGGGEDSKCYIHAGPPFKKITVTDAAIKLNKDKDKDKALAKPSENCHVRGSVHCIRYNVQGTMIASVGTDKSLCFYHGKTMELIHRMELLHASSIYSCAWNSHGDQLLTCSADGYVHLVSTKDYDFKIVQSWDLVRNNRNGKVPLGAMQMGCTFVQGDIPITVSLSGKITILPLSSSASSTSTLKSLTGHQSPVSCMTINHTNGIMYTGDSDGVICMWDICTGTSITNVQRQQKREEDSGTISTSNADMNTSIDSMSSTVNESFDETLLNKVHKGAITGLVSVSTNNDNGNSNDSDGTTLLSIGWDDKIRLTHTSIAKSSIQLPSQPNQIHKGTDLVVVMTVGGLILVRNDRVVSDLIVLSYEPSCVCVSSDDGIVYVGGKDCSIHIYSVSSNDNDGDGNGNSYTLDEIRTLSGTHLQPIYALSISNDGTKLASADVRDICIWNINEEYSTKIGKGRWCFHNQRINALTWSNDDTILASGGNDDSIFLWSLKKPLRRVHYSFAHRGGITAMEFLKNADGMILASVGNDGCVNQWDVTDDIIKKFG